MVPFLDRGNCEAKNPGRKLEPVLPFKRGTTSFGYVHWRVLTGGVLPVGMGRPVKPWLGSDSKLRVRLKRKARACRKADSGAIVSGHAWPEAAVP